VNPLAICLDHVSAQFQHRLKGAITAVHDVSLEVQPGELLTLLGPSGCGKTTTLRMIAGHERATEGDILIGAANVTDLPPAKRGTAMMFQSYALFPHLSCVTTSPFRSR
jgi:putative spermidine/putrescine transport system ATP-binding protein